MHVEELKFDYFTSKNLLLSCSMDHCPARDPVFFKWAPRLVDRRKPLLKPPAPSQPPIVHNDVKYMSVILVHLHDSSTPRGSARMGFGGSVFECWCPHSRLASFESACKTCKCDV